MVAVVRAEQQVRVARCVLRVVLPVLVVPMAAVAAVMARADVLPAGWVLLVFLSLRTRLLT